MIIKREAARMYLNSPKIEYFLGAIGDVRRRRVGLGARSAPAALRLAATRARPRGVSEAGLALAGAAGRLATPLGGEVAQFIRDLLPCVADWEPVGVHVPYAVEDER